MFFFDLKIFFFDLKIFFFLFMDKKKRWEKEQVLQMNFFFFKG
jgi:hypothetical protein